MPRHELHETRPIPLEASVTVACSHGDADEDDESDVLVIN